MKKCLLSIDWDYFIYSQNGNLGSFSENKTAIIDLWYKRYLKLNKDGRDIQKIFRLSTDVDHFWDRIKTTFRLKEDIKAYVSDSHALSYDIAESNGCSSVYLFDAHSDLGYGGLSSLNFEVNCANWLGKLLKNNRVNEANIVYSPFSMEKPGYFSLMNKIYNIRYPSVDDLNPEINIEAIHICRSGAWTPPWFDERFLQFVKDSGVPYKISDCPARKWDIKNMSLSDQIYYMMA